MSGCWVRADSTTEKISGYYITDEDMLIREFKLVSEQFVQVSRVPDLRTDMYVNLVTGEMRTDP